MKLLHKVGMGQKLPPTAEVVPVRPYTLAEHRLIKMAPLNTANASVFENVSFIWFRNSHYAEFVNFLTKLKI